MKKVYRIYSRKECYECDCLDGFEEYINFFSIALVKLNQLELIDLQYIWYSKNLDKKELSQLMQEYIEL